jgi:hypothetical protein
MANAAVLEGIADPDCQVELYNDHGDAAEFISLLDPETGDRHVGKRRSPSFAGDAATARPRSTGAVERSVWSRCHSNLPRPGDRSLRRSRQLARNRRTTATSARGRGDTTPHIAARDRAHRPWLLDHPAPQWWRPPPTGA